MNQQTFLQIQKNEMQRMLERAKDDPIIAPQLRERIEDAEEELEALQRQEGTLLPRENVMLPRAAIFLRGGGGQDSDGIRPALAGEALIRYEQMFVQQALQNERDSAQKAGKQRRPRGSRNPQLLFSGTPRGSFGLEFVPWIETDDFPVELHARAFHQIADALERVTDSDRSKHDQSIGAIPTGVLRPLKQFLKTLARHGAELRLAFSDQKARTITSEQIRTAADRLDRDVSEEDIEVTGTFRGITFDTGNFDFRADNETISGVVSEELTEDDLKKLVQLTDQPCTAKLQKTTVQTVTGSASPTYVLLCAAPAIQGLPGHD